MPLSAPRGPFDADRVMAFLDASALPLRLAVNAPSGWPVVVSLWFARANEHILCATQASSPIVAALARDARCAFEVAGCDPPYRGVRGRGTVTIEPDEQLRTLRLLLTRYLGSTDGALARRLLARTTPEVVLRIDPVSMSSWDYSARMSR